MHPKLRALHLLLTLLAIASLSLSACEVTAPQPQDAGSTATPRPSATHTSVPATNTLVPATSTPAPPTGTALPPSPTAPEPTATPTAEPSPTPPDPSALLDKVWSLVFYGDPADPTGALDDVEVSVLFAAGRASGRAGCNGYFGGYEVDGDTISFGAMGNTQMWCGDEIMAQELACLQALASATTWRVSGARLEIAYDGGDGLLVFRATAPPLMTAKGELTLEGLSGAEYAPLVASDYGVSAPVRLANGAFRRSIPGSASEVLIQLTDATLGDLNGDGVVDAAVILATNGGGSGTFIELGAVLNQGGAPAHVASVLLGDRVRIAALAIDAGQIVVDMVSHAVDDPLCCPTLEVTQRFALRDGELVGLTNGRGPAIPGPALYGTTWVLVAYGDAGSPKPVLEATEATALFNDQGQVSGGATCNRYFGSFELAGSALSVSAVGTTRMACPAEEMSAQERDFVSLLQAAASYAIEGTQLRIETSDGKVLIFETKEASAAMVEITTPVDGAKLTAGQPIAISGTGRALFENNVIIQVLDAQGSVLAVQPTTMTSEEVGGEGAWSMEISVTAQAGATLTIEAFADSPRDGSIVAYDKVEVTLVAP